MAQIGMELVEGKLKEILQSKTSAFYVFLSKKKTEDTEWYYFTQKRNSKEKNGVRTYTRRILCVNDNKRGIISPDTFAKVFKPLYLKYSTNMFNMMKLEAWLQSYTIDECGEEPRSLHCVSGGGRTDKWVMGEKHVVGITYNLDGISPFMINPEPTVAPL